MDCIQKLTDCFQSLTLPGEAQAFPCNVEEVGLNTLRSDGQVMVDRYGDQGLYKTLEGHVITAITETLRNLVGASESSKTSEQFLQLLNGIGILRSEMAKRMQSPNQELFGHPRTNFIPAQAIVSTPCYTGTRYTDLGDKIKSTMTPLIKGMIGATVKLGRQITNQHFRYTVRPIFKADLGNILTVINKVKKKELSSACEEALIAADRFVSINRFRNDLANDNAVVNNCIHKAQQGFQELFLEGTVEKMVDNKWVRLTRHFAFCHTDGQGKVTNRTLEDFQQNGQLLIVHTPRENLVDLQPDVASAFLEAFQWDGVDRSVLYTALAKLTFRLSHVMYFYRGSAASTEFLIKALLKHHNITDVKLANQVDREALACPFENQFVDTFSSNFLELLVD